MKVITKSNLSLTRYERIIVDFTVPTKKITVRFTTVFSSVYNNIVYFSVTIDDGIYVTVPIIKSGNLTVPTTITQVETT